MNESPHSLTERHLAFVYSSALRRTGDPAQAADITRAVFLVLARRARKLSRKTDLAAWLFHVTAVASRKVMRRGFRFWRRPRRVLPPDASLWMRATPEIDRALERLSKRQRSAVLLCAFLKHEPASAATVLRTKERRVQRRLNRGLRKTARRLRGRGVVIDSDALALACATEGCNAPVPAGLAAEIVRSMEENAGRQPSFKLARRILRTLAWARWRRRIAIGVPSFVAVLATILGLAWYVDSLSGHSRSLSAVLVWMVRREAKTVPGLTQPARPWPTDGNGPRLNGALVRSAQDIFQKTNIWQAHLKFSAEQWKALQPKKIGALPHFLQPDGTALLRNPKASRSGLAGVLGYDFKWTQADLEFGGVRFTNVGARIKGNGTWLSSLYGEKRAFKVDLNKFAPGQKFAGLDEFAFNNLVGDHSFMSDALGYEFFREAGVPASRTAYAWLSVSVAGRWQAKPFGLYAMIEPIDPAFAAEQFGSKKTPLFKPVTYQLFEYCGEEWSAYAAAYDLKTKATPQQLQRVIELARLVSQANDEDFAAHVGEFLDLDEFARFLAAHVLLSHYDSILADGQNYYLYLDPRSNKFGFIPWDMDLAWGGFFLLGSTKERERASIWHPWVGQNRFIERVMKVEAFRKIYRAHLEDFLARLFVPERLYERIDALAAVIREPVAAESDFRLDKFEQAIGAKPLQPSPKNPTGQDRTAHRLKVFIKERAKSVRQQLDGTSNGMILQRPK